MSKDHDGKILWALLAGAAAWLFWPKKTFAVDVLSVDKNLKQVSYTVKAEDKTASDTFRMGDPVSLFQIGDSSYYVFAEGKPLFDQIQIAVGTMVNGGFVAQGKVAIITF